MFEKILVCLDGSSLAEQILPYAIEEAIQFDSLLVLLQVIKIPDSASKDAADAPVRIKEVIEDSIRKQEQETREYFNTIEKSLIRKGVKTKSVLLRPSPVGEAILDYAANNDIGLICIATHGHSGLGRVFFGSVAEYLLKESGLPLLVIRPQKE
ncbi:MAG: universal stress protein [Dehalococcoidaceae bacterium]|nr:universal stress protein [Dehalococcoidaceae bacterium]